jgi:hypothetical protein
MEINKKELYKLYMEWVNKVSDECDWKTSFGPEEIVYAIAGILENNPNLIKTSKPNNEQYNQIIDKAFSNYLNTYSGNFELDREEFINASKTAPDFSEHWGLQFEERELTYSERYRYWFTHNYETGLEYDERNIPDFDNTYYDPTPTRLITITYKDEKIKSYE